MIKILVILLMLGIPMGTVGQRIYYDSTFTSNGHRFHVQLIQLEHYMNLLKVSDKKNVILADTLDFTTELELLDFNGDDGIDIMLNFMGNVDHQSLFLFDKSTETFKRVKDFEEYQEAKRVGISAYYYSYHRSGCADSTWTSDLFAIVDYKVVHLGKIFGDGCEEPKQVKVYRIKAGKTNLVEILPYSVVTENSNDKRGFIDDYWTKNYRKYQ